MKKLLWTTLNKTMNGASGMDVRGLDLARVVMFQFPDITHFQLAARPDPKAWVPRRDFLKSIFDGRR